jgi:murein DD-endopeptidase MepM/ murein hydrolase activator NlpD
MKKAKLHFLPRIFMATLCTFTLFFAAGMGKTSADQISDLKQKIDTRIADIAALEKEIAQYEQQIQDLGTQATTLANSIKMLDITRKKLEADISVTQNKIAAENLIIQKLELDISDKQTKINLGTSAIAEMIRSMDQTDSKTLIEVILSTENFSQFWNDVSTLQHLERVVDDKVKELQDLKTAREEDKAQAERERRTLIALNQQLAGQKRVADANKAEKSKLLAATKNTESNYQKILAKKQALKKAFEDELNSFQLELKVAIDPNSLPSVGSGVLSWPLDTVRITQYFGNTAFAQSGAYNGKGHNGIDMAASYGTPIRAAAAGTVMGTGDTDIVCPGASYGRWVLVEHRNGLSTLYAHLSVISVSSGQEVNTGDILGYSGDTGYATGPHLHFTVYATQGVSIQQLKSKVCKGTYTMPIAPLNAYLDPMNYLKKL